MDRSLYWVKTTIVPFMDNYNKPQSYISIRTDITAQKNIKKIVHIAYHDDLTGLPNRRSLTKRVENAISTGLRNNSEFALLFFDVNRFKNINDSLGHKMGDLFLKELANRLRQIDIQAESFYRLNGDEFVYILDDVTLIDDMAERILEVFKESFVFEEYEFYASVSLGISIFPQHGESVSKLLKTADFAMYAAKAKKGNCYSVYKKEMRGTNDRFLLLETKLHKAVRDNKLEIYYQPKYNIQSGEVVGAEAIICWTDEEFGTMKPKEFIPFAVQCGLITEINKWMIEKVVYQLASMKEMIKSDFKMAINVSSDCIKEQNFIAELTAILEKLNISAKQIEIEISELDMLDTDNQLVDKIKQMNELGFQIAVDDFGIGYSSLNYLREVPISLLKIDHSFTKDLNLVPANAKMVAAIVSLAGALNLQVIAESVENGEDLAILKELNCQFAQGPFLNEPLRKEDFVSYVARINNITECLKEPFVL